MKVCVAGEGIWDVGWSRNREDGPEYAGDVPLILAAIVRERLGRNRRFVCEGWTHAGLPHVHPPIADGWPRPPAEALARELLFAAAAASHRDDVDALVFVRDSRLDGHEDRRRACEQVLRECRVRGDRPPVVLGLAVQEIEVWLLADPQSRAAAFGAAVGNRECGTPEELPDPKQCWRTMLGEAAAGGGDGRFDAECRTRAIEAMRPKVVADSCHRGFGPFRQGVVDTIVPRLHPGHAAPGGERT
ncbi:MAG: hypothetical protein HY905_25675 [Deltaproteobacteria bacterium]|nr:hypothetical protein [Deltaproteobacteria bacterium]